MKKRQLLIASINSVLILILSTGCSMLQKKVDPSREYTTDSGFQFRFPMSGDWYPGSSQKGKYIVGQKSSADGTSKLAIVRHGPIHTPAGKAMTNNEIFEIFKRDIENEAKNGSVSKVKNNFNQKTYKGADCLTFEQSGDDKTAEGLMSINNEGMICLHPNRPYHFVWMAISERWPLGKPGGSDFTEDKKQFFTSLKFIK